MQQVCTIKIWRHHGPSSNFRSLKEDVLQLTDQQSWSRKSGAAANRQWPIDTSGSVDSIGEVVCFPEDSNANNAVRAAHPIAP